MTVPTQFPFETDQPQFDLTLPVGTHVLELFVEDNEGRVSPPVSIIVIVDPDRDQFPIIDDFAPDWLTLGEHADPFLIKGHRLRVKHKNPEDLSGHSVEFLYPDRDEVDECLEATIKPQSNEELLVLDVGWKRKSKCVPGPRRVRVTTPDGSGFALTNLLVKV